MHTMKRTTSIRFKETRRIGRYTVHAATNTWGSIELRVWEDSSPMGNHASIGGRDDYGDALSSAWVGELTSRRSACTLPVGEGRFRFLDLRRKRLAALELGIARRAFEQWQIERERCGDLLKK